MTLMKNEHLKNETDRLARSAKALCLLLVFALACGCFVAKGSAYAEGLTTAPVDDRSQFQIELLEAAYDSAMEEVAQAEALVAENQAKIDVLEAEIPIQQELSDKSIRALYLMQQNKLDYIDVLMDSKSFVEFINEVDYFSRIGQMNLDELNKLKGMLAELEEARIALDEAKALADEKAASAQRALVALQDERAARQWDGISNALAQASSEGGPTFVADGADWYMTEEEFVAEWAPRIDAYLAGSPMEGTGEYFALASFRYCVDPRWSPAIANSESSKGRKCIRPYNAWGWGAADEDPYNLAYEWSSWEEAIDAHVRGLSRGYGYTISWSAAKKYCTGWKDWYPNTVTEMAKI